MVHDANIQRQISSVEQSIQSINREVSNLQQQVKLMNRQTHSSDREKARTRELVREATKRIDSLGRDRKTYERQLSELKRMAR